MGRKIDVRIIKKYMKFKKNQKIMSSVVREEKRREEKRREEKRREMHYTEKGKYKQDIDIPCSLIL